MKLASCFCALLIATVLAASTVLAAPVLKNGDRWPVSSPRAVAVDTVNNLVFMARGNVLTVLDASLNVTGHIDLEAEIQCISYYDGYVYAATGGAGLQIVDVSNLSTTPTTFLPTNWSTVASVFATNGYAYITNIGNRFMVLDITTPTAPSYEGSTTLSGLLVSAVNVHVFGTTAAVVDQVNGLHLLNVADKDNPQWESVTAIAGAFDVRLDDSYAYVASIAGGLDIVDISDTSDPELRGSYPTGDGYSVGVFVNGDTAYLADQVNGLHIINLNANRDNPTLNYTAPGTIGAYSVAVDGANVYVGDYSQGLQLMGGASYNPPTNAQDIFVDNDGFLYVVSGSTGGNADEEGLRILSAKNPGNIGYSSFTATDGEATDVFVSGTDAYVTDSVSGLMIIDALDPASPSVTGPFGTAGAPSSVAVAGTTAYVSEGADGLEIVNLTSLSQAGLFPTTPRTALSVVVSGGYAYVSEGADGLEIVNLSNLTQEDVFSTAGTAVNAAVSGNYAYIAEGVDGIEIVNISNKSDPVFVGSYDTDGIANDVVVSGRYLYIADGTNGLVVLDVSDPANPSKIEEWSTGTTAEALAVRVAGEYVYMAEGLGGAAIYQLTDEDPFVPTPLPDSDSGGGCFISNLGF